MRFLIARIVLTLLPAAITAVASANEAACPNIQTAAKTQTPVELYQAVVACAKEARYDDAAEFFALAGVFGRFDTYRVDDVSAHSAAGALKSLSLNAIPNPNRDELQKTAMSTYEDHEKHAALCLKVSALGPPTYEPTYMRAHGLNALLGKAPSTDKSSESFDAKLAWLGALSSYLGCQSG